ncbi:VTC domain-containing protein [Bacteroides thetaiotaomicron]|uniref:VTC domain-containing protein n=1 Tax=Bacteroides thetaiotaomicron TaxID=818 RepID=UPI0035B06C3A
MLENSFHRVTLVNNHKTERLTIDTGVKFRCLQSGKISSLDNIVIIELKQDGHNSSPIKRYYANYIYNLPDFPNIV